MLTIRLKDLEEKKLEEYCKLNNLSKTFVVKEAIAMYIKKESDKMSPYESGKDLFGQEGSQDKDLSTTYKERIKKSLAAKFSH